MQFTFLIIILQYFQVWLISSAWIKRFLFWFFTVTNSMAYGIWRFNAAITRALQQSLSWADSTQFLVLIQVSLKSILILSSHIRLGGPKGLLRVSVQLKFWKHFYLLPFCLHDMSISSFHTVQNMKFFIEEPSPLSIRNPSWAPIFASGLFLNTLSRRSSLNVREPASQPYSTCGNIIVLYTLIFKFLERSREYKMVWTE